MSTMNAQSGLAEPLRLVERILAVAQDAAASGQGRVPTERQLAEQFGVSRTSVRHALTLLEAEGVLSREVGRGTFLRDKVAPVTSEDISALTDISPADVMAVRSLLEPAAMPLVVTRATTRDFLEIDRCLKGGDAASSYAEFETWDMAFHRALIRASHNPLLIHLYGAIETARHGQLFGELKRRHDSADQRGRYQDEHHAVGDAARSRDEQEAVSAMRTHLANITANLFGPLL